MSRLPHGRRGLKSSLIDVGIMNKWSPSTRKAWIEIYKYAPTKPLR